jgi:hypothetical protein
LSAQTKKRREPPLGYALGYPLFHGVTGQLPVLSLDLLPPTADLKEEDASDAFKRSTGMLPVLSTDLVVGSASVPGWVELIDPITGHLFWWNIHFRKRRDVHPEHRSRRGSVQASDSVLGGIGQSEQVEEEWDSASEEDGESGEEEEAVTVYPPLRGWLKKKGGAYRMLGSDAWRDRFFVAEQGHLSYYASEADSKPAGRGPCKGLTINLAFYKVDPQQASSVQFSLVPKTDALAELALAGTGALRCAQARSSGRLSPRRPSFTPPQTRAVVKHTERVFVLQAADPTSKRRWIEALQGRTMTQSGSFRSTAPGTPKPGAALLAARPSRRNMLSPLENAAASAGLGFRKR